ncbi:serine/threonine protein kinase, partial [Staphylococcus succinus]
MDFRYFNYINLENTYYIKQNQKKKSFTLLHSDKNYIKIEDEHWVNYLYEPEKLPDQGWKIHISSLPSTAQKILDEVSSILMKNKISFKFVKNYQQLFEKNSKYADRTASGKFITIYPENYKSFICLLDTLHNTLKKYPKGPYILTDKRWYDSNVYFRYGAFKKMFFFENGKKKLAIKNNKGTFIEDVRKPYYVLPDFIQEPQELKIMEEYIENEKTELSHLEQYTIIKVLHYSNGGGVYLAKNNKGKNVVIKEGRPGSGLDSLENDAFQRIYNEAKTLYKLKNQHHTVDIYDHFIEWEHIFIVEEYIEGTTLNEWLLNNYPFYSNKENNKYKDNAIYILEQLYEALNEIHAENISIGDLSPNNIIITSDYKVRLIDFETANIKNSELPIALNTLGFAGNSNMNRKSADWFSLLRLSRFIFLPIGPVQDISLNILKKHDDFIKLYFGSDPFNIIRKIEEHDENHELAPLSNFIEYDYYKNNEKDINDLISKILNHLSENIDYKNKLIYGDIRQYEIDNGHLNILTGYYGAIFTLNRINQKNDEIAKCLENPNLNNIFEMSEGLFLGKSGVATALWENGEKKSAERVLNSIKDYQNSNDITITSGLAGIGLAFIGFSYEPNFQDYIMKAIDIGKKLEILLEKDLEISTYDIDITNIGLMNGWSGVSLFYSSLFKRTNDKKWLSLSEKALNKDLEKGIYSLNDKTYHLDDIYRLMPYLDGGSAGVGLSLIEFCTLTKKNDYNKELNGIRNLRNSKMFYNVGLFRGTLGIIDVARSIDKFYDSNMKFNDLEKLKIHLIFMDNAIATPGEFNYRLSDDVFSGSLGTLLVLEAMKNNKNFLWMPVPNIEKTFATNNDKPK